mmetsp:Transcript_152236/g.270103  ORF Transcript_152236/g.270103 Transcript_152236/m.270103 type:complete len:130 (-) Transcript_152236:493-882(-)
MHLGIQVQLLPFCKHSPQTFRALWKARLYVGLAAHIANFANDELCEASTNRLYHQHLQLFKQRNRSLRETVSNHTRTTKSTSSLSSGMTWSAGLSGKAIKYSTGIPHMSNIKINKNLPTWCLKPLRPNA